ncbi:PilN domain-containing protein [Desulfospira joergensenii]|uniref:PilN domain-containing protein n=1 Tax=Desulfospira joergensenii TaxID=53329 RepID=UPI0003B71264|nr:PilN domain-containing protein [Desulfospira joergensenii]
MDRSFLRLELDDLGVHAAVAGKGPRQIQAPDECRIRFEDLPPSEEASAFDTAMDLIAARLDLSSCSQATILVSSLWISFRSVDLPFSSPKKVRQVLGFELESLLPLSNEDYISDFFILKSGEKKGQGSNRVQTASIFESRVRGYAEKLKAMGIQPRLITPRGYAAALAYLGIHREKENSVFLSLTDTEVSLVIILQGRPCSLRSFPAAGMDAQEISIKVKQAVIGFNQRTGNRRFFEISVCSDRDPEKTRTIVIGLEKVFDPDGVTVAELSSKELLATVLPQKKGKYLFNFCQGEYGSSSFVKKHLGSMVAAAILFAAVFGLFMTGTAMDNARLAARIAVIDSRALDIFTQTFPQIKKVQDPYLQMKANLKNAAKKAGSGGKKASDQRTFKLVQIMNELSDRIDASIDMDISRFLFNNGRIVLSGSTDNFNNVDKIKGRIESSDLFKTVEISSAAADKKGNRVNFKFIIEM